MGQAHEWEEVSRSGPFEGFSEITMRMKVPGGYLYNVILMHVRGWSPKISNSVTFVPDKSN